MHRVGRLVKILILLQAHSTLTAKQLAEILKVNERTIYRDVDALSLWGVPIFSMAGHGGGYSLPEEYTIDPNTFNLQEIEAFNTGSLALAQFTDLIEGKGEIEVARAKLVTMLSSEEKLIISRQIKYVLFDFSRWYRKYTQQNTLRLIKNSTLKNRKLKISYHERKDVEKSKVFEAEVDPYGLVFKSDTWYLVGFVEAKKIIRRWNITRIVDAILLEDEFNRPRDFVLEKWWKEELERFGKGDIRVLIAISKNVWHRFKRVGWKKDNKFFDDKKNIFVEMLVDDYEWIIDLVLVNRGSLVVLEPEELINKINEATKRIQKNHNEKNDKSFKSTDYVDFEVMSVSFSDLD